MIAPARVASSAAALLLVLAACTGQIDRSIPQCSAAAVSYCQTNGCPLTGPTASDASTVDAWCASTPALAPRVTGFGTCTLASGATWAINVRATDASGDILYLL